MLYLIFKEYVLFKIKGIVIFRLIRVGDLNVFNYFEVFWI